MRELHMPDGKPVVINPEAVAFLHPLGHDTTLIGFGGGGTLTVQGGYEDILIDLGLVDQEAPILGHDDHDDDEPEIADEQESEASEPRPLPRGSLL